MTRIFKIFLSLTNKISHADIQQATENPRTVKSQLVHLFGVLESAVSEFAHVSGSPRLYYVGVFLVFGIQSLICKTEFCVPTNILMSFGMIVAEQGAAKHQDPDSWLTSYSTRNERFVVLGDQ